MLRKFKMPKNIYHVLYHPYYYIVYNVLDHQLDLVFYNNSRLIENDFREYEDILKKAIYNSYIIH